MSKLTQTKSWQALSQHYQQIAGQHMRDWFAADSQRFDLFSQETAGILLDYSKNRITAETLTLLLALADERQLTEHIAQLFSGALVNQTEQRAAMHMALRYQGDQAIKVDGDDVMPQVREVHSQMAQLVTAIRERKLLGFSGQPIDTIVNIGIGGSDLGPQLALTALADIADSGLSYHFLSTHDQWYVNKTLKQLNPATTLLIIASKSFTTEETLINAELAKQWQLAAAPNLAAAQRHWVAVTAMSERAYEFGVLPEQVFSLWDWVGGRYSLWSAVGLIVAIAIGMPGFLQLLAGADAMDQHFQTAEFSQNMPVILALLDFWYQQFFQASTRAVIPYGQRLHVLPSYLQQLHMESLGKRVTQAGEPVDTMTGNIIWGGQGTDSQHSFHQLLMQGTQMVPVDFILALNNAEGMNDQRLLSHCLAQSQVLMQGYSAEQIRQQQQSRGIGEDLIERLLPHQQIPGNSPSNTLLLSELSPYRLGALIALYEHRVFTYSVLVGINAFDQWGVERGKHIASKISADLHDSSDSSCYDASTIGLLNWANAQGVKR